MKFSTEYLAEDIYNTETTVLDEITGHSRWSVQHRRIFRFEGKLYETTYSVGATEMQDESPYEYGGPDEECPEVVAVERLVTVYERIDC